jgi:hypothetical protein
MSSANQPSGVIARLLDLSELRVQQLSRDGVIPNAERERGQTQRSNDVQ